MGQTRPSKPFRVRLERADGTAASEVMPVSGPDGALDDHAIAKMDEWLGNICRDTAPGSALDRIVRSRPGDLSDACFVGGPAHR